VPGAVAELIRRYCTLWHESPSHRPEPGPRHGWLARKRNERATDALVDSLETTLTDWPDSKEERSAREREIRAVARTYLFDRIALSREFEPVLLSDEYSAATSDFLHRAREFDPDLAAEDLFQAIRNVWIMNCVQMLLDLPVAVTPSVFAYSLLYPYTDNYLDRADVDDRAKVETVERLGRRLRGETLPAANPTEGRTFHLIATIEREFPRSDHAAVWDSLSAIHGGQVRSLCQQRSGERSDEEILAISVEKGGSSVLADGFLVAGSLSRAEADFLFGYGVFLQLLDDLQDVREDSEAGHRTLFSGPVREGLLDRQASRLYHFTVKVLESDHRFRAAHHRVLKNLIRTSCTHLFLQAVGMNPENFSRRFLRRMNRYSPVRFSYLGRRRDTIRRRFDRVGRTLEHRFAAAGVPAPAARAG
jgi:hypothetical protein